MKRYRMILDLLDDGKEITEETVLLLEQLPAEEGQILVTNEGEFLFRTKRNILTNWNSYASELPRYTKVRHSWIMYTYSLGQLERQPFCSVEVPTKYHFPEMERQCQP